MKIILSPAKKMRIDDAGPVPASLPVFLPETEEILSWLRGKTAAELKALWSCNDRIAQQNIDRLEHMDLYHDLTPAIYAYDGIAFQYMAPAAFDTKQLDYIRSNLRILSAFYGVLKPMDGVAPYRLEMQAKASVSGCRDLYNFWSDRLYREVRDDSGIIIDLASAEYSKCIRRYITTDDRYITVTFLEPSASGKLITRAVHAKMARGEMVRYMAENGITDPDDLKYFDRQNYRFREDLSTETDYVFERGL